MSINTQSDAYRRHAAVLTDVEVSPPPEPATSRWPRLARRSARPPAPDPRARAEADEVLAALRQCVEELGASLGRLSALDRPRLRGKVDDEQRRVTGAAGHLQEAGRALDDGDFGAAGKASTEAHRQLSAIGGAVMAALGQELSQAALPRDRRTALQTGLDLRRAALEAADRDHARSPRAGMLASARAYRGMAENLGLAAEILAQQPAAPTSRVSSRRAPGDGTARVVSSETLETFADVGGLDGPLEHLRRVVGAAMRPPDATSGQRARVQNGILLHGPPGTGKSLLARAAAGEYGLRFLHVSPATVASHPDPAAQLRQLFDLAADSAPCLLFLDEVDLMAVRRHGGASVGERQLTTQLMQSLEDHRGSSGLVVMAATNALDQLDPALREGRFDSRIAVPLPDAEARAEIVTVQLEAGSVSVDWDTIDVEEIAQRTAGRSGAFLATVVDGAAQRAVGRSLGGTDLEAELESRSGTDRAQTLQQRVDWGDVVLPEATRRRLQEILLVFQRPELGRRLGVVPPAGILLYGPPGTGKTTVARALASEVNASFYEQSAADLLSKWVGESEQKVAQLFTRARANVPSIIFCDEIDTLVKQRRADSSTPWEERVVSQFLQELDGLHSGQGVLLVGATNRPDIIDDAVWERRLVPIEVPLPDASGRRALLEMLWRDVRLDAEVDLETVVAATEDMSGADLKALRDSAGMKALSRVARPGTDPTADVAVSLQDVAESLAERGRHLDPGPPARRPPARRPPARRPAARRPPERAAAEGRPPAARRRPPPQAARRTPDVAHRRNGRAKAMPERTDTTDTDDSLETN